MAKQEASEADTQRVLATVTRLVTAADGDTLFRDVYLHRAAELLSPIVTEASWTASLGSRDQLARLLAQARAAVAQQDWANVHETGARAASLQRSLDADKAVLDVAETVYGAAPVVLDPLSPGLTSKRWGSAAQARTDVCAALNELGRDDEPRRDLYAARQRAVEALVVPGAPASGAPVAATSSASAEQQALHALERGDASALESLAASMLGRRTATESDAGPTVARGAIAVPQALGDPFPGASVTKAKSLGLEAVETELATGAVAGEIVDFIQRYALGASAAVHDRAKDGIARLSIAAGEIAVPAGVVAVFAETISLFALHLYVNSAGVRYVPIPAPRETVLVETHAEGDETVTPLLRELGLERRRGVARDDIEHRLQKQGPRIVGELLGLDPLAFRIVCVPPDVFARVGRDRGWGARPEWTHFDGYQVMRGGRIRALVGGHKDYGGLYDLASISRDDARENTLARFAVIRRERLGVRIG
jgi:hypothetical protein